MAVISTDGLIIKEQKVGENDRLVTILTRDRGIVRAFVTGALKLKSRNVSSTQLLSYSRLNLYRGRDTYKVNSGEAIEVFFALRDNIEALALAGYLCELLVVLAPEEDNAEDFLRIALNSLHFLCDKTRNFELIKAVFELKICRFAGYMPDVFACAKCGGEDMDKIFFDVRGGIILCGECIENERAEGIYQLPGAVLTAMRHILYSPWDKLFSFRLNDESARILSLVSERFVAAQTERKYKTLDFYKSVKL